MSRIAVVLLNWNGWRDTAECIGSLLRLDRDVGIIVCDNASTDGSSEHLEVWAQTALLVLNKDRADRGRAPYIWRRHDPPLRNVVPPPVAEPAADDLCTITFIPTGANLGFAGGNNVGLRYALTRGYDFFWVLNNDTQPMPDALDRACARMADDPQIGICGSTMVYMSHPDVVQCLGGGTFDRLKGRGAQLGTGARLSDPIDGPSIEKALSFISGAAMLVSRGFLMDVGLMYEGYFLYYEEINWAMRAAGRYRLGYAPRSIVLHKVGASIGTSDFGSRSPLSDYYMHRNRVRLLLQYSKGSLPFMVVDVLRHAAIMGFREGWRRAWLILAASLQLPYSIAVRPAKV